MYRPTTTDHRIDHRTDVNTGPTTTDRPTDRPTTDRPTGPVGPHRPHHRPDGPTDRIDRIGSSPTDHHRFHHRPHRNGPPTHRPMTASERTEYRTITDRTDRPDRDTEWTVSDLILDHRNNYRHVPTDRPTDH
jgi:hypothetical protein